VSPFETVLACTIILAAIIQIIVLFRIQRSLARFTARAGQLMDGVDTHIHKVSDGVQSLQKNLRSSSEEVHATLAGIRATTDAMSEIAQEEAREVSRLVEKTTGMAQRQVEEAERLIEQARLRIAELGEGFDQKVIQPLHGVLAIAVGIRKGAEILLGHRSSRDVTEKAPSDVGSS
jgi:DNA anti-recombination protein RmuC